MQILSNHTIKINIANKYAHYIHCAIEWPAKAPTMYTCTVNTSQLMHAIDSLVSICSNLAQRYNSLSLKGAREQYASDIYGLHISWTLFRRFLCDLEDRRTLYRIPSEARVL